LHLETAMFRADAVAAQRRAEAERIERRDSALATALLTVCAGFVALWPYTSVIAAGPWTLISIVLILVIAGTGLLVRIVRFGRFGRGPWGALARCVVAVMAVTMMLMPQGAFLGLIPTGTTLQTLGQSAADAVEQVQFGTAPLADTPALRVVLGIGFAVVAIVL